MTLTVRILTSDLDLFNTYSTLDIGTTFYGLFFGQILLDTSYVSHLRMISATIDSINVNRGKYTLGQNNKRAEQILSSA
jgi:hypothetical protein